MLFILHVHNKMKIVEAKNIQNKEIAHKTAIVRFLRERQWNWKKFALAVHDLKIISIPSVQYGINLEP